MIIKKEIFPLRDSQNTEQKTKKKKKVVICQLIS